MRDGPEPLHDPELFNLFLNVFDIFFSLVGHLQCSDDRIHFPDLARTNALRILNAR